MGNGTLSIVDANSRQLVQTLTFSARVRVPHQNRLFTARVSDVLPQFDPVTRTMKLRLEAENPDYALRPEMFVDIEFPVTLGNGVTVSTDAVLDSGVRKTVFVERTSGVFEPRIVETGWRFGDRVQIVRGVTPGEHVVVSGNFFVDSESRLRLAAAGIYSAAVKDPVCGMMTAQSKAAAAGRKINFRGTTYFFCSDKCRHDFENDPARNTDKPTSTSIPAAPRMKTGHARPETGLGDAKDPVCGITIDAKKAASGRRSDYRGVTYYFCSDSCKRNFDKHPESYLKKTSDTAAGSRVRPGPKLP